MMNWNLLNSFFIFVILLLSSAQQTANGLLGQIVVFSQVAETWKIHITSPLSPAQQVVGSNVVKVSQCDEMLQGQITFSRFISAVYALVDSKDSGHLPLCQVAVLSQIAETWQIHINHLVCIVCYYHMIVFLLLSYGGKITIEVIVMKTTRYYMVEAEVCGTCIHYHQHYVLSMGQIFSPLWYGHCGRRGMRHPQPDDVCPHFTKREKEPDSDG